MKRSLPEQLEAWDGLLHAVPGFRTAAVHCGLKTAAEQPPDLALLTCERTVAAAGVFTTNRVCAAPVKQCRRNLKSTKNRARALLINAGNANACTGLQGAKDAARMAALAAADLGCSVGEVLVFSTGIIGRKLPMEKVEAGLQAALAGLKHNSCTGDFARAIMTTDLVPKTAGVRLTLDGCEIHISGACKGSGMIAPDMATMLGVVATDAAIEPQVLQTLLADVAGETFNCVSVDGDTSTNDSLACFASGLAGNKPVNQAQGPAYLALRAGLLAVCDSLARQIAADGEGATHLITLYIGGTRTDREARKIARTVAESPLVKTAIAGNDPNWGRIMAAAGRAGVVFDPNAASLTLNGHEVFRGGEPTQFDKATVAAALRSREVGIVLLAGDGPGRAKFYSCDLTHEYITINADYHT